MPPQILSFVPGPILLVPTEIKILSSSLAELAAGLVAGCMPTFPQLFRQSIPKVSAGLRGYWSRARTSLLTSNHSHQPLAAKGSWESRERTHNYLELDERGGQGFGKTVEDKRPDLLALGGDGKGKEEDLESGKGNGNGGRKGSNGIRKTITVEQEHV